MKKFNLTKEKVEDCFLNFLAILLFALSVILGAFLLNNFGCCTMLIYVLSLFTTSKIVSYFQDRKHHKNNN